MVQVCASLNCIHVADRKYMSAIGDLDVEELTTKNGDHGKLLVSCGLS